MFTQRIEYEAQLTKCFKTMLPNGKKKYKISSQKIVIKITIPFSHINVQQECI